MSFLNTVRAGLLILIGLVAIFFVVRNPSERVTIDLIFFPVRENVLLIELLFYALVLGAIGGYSVALIKIIELKGQVSSARRSQGRLESEITTLRNLPLEDDDSTGTPEEKAL